MVSFGTFISHVFESSPDVFIPDMSPLLCAIDSLHEFQHHAFRNMQPWRRLHIDLLLQFSIEVSGFNIHLVNFQVKLSGDGEDSAE